mmetsp:Transcript_39954/g.93518  ORF Transcript_39954/g.93518 Transcript_39954/m.93518 type:complete len:86 (+) Transcript_39954:793-1050(+)
MPSGGIAGWPDYLAPPSPPKKPQDQAAAPSKDKKLAWDCDFKASPAFELDLGKLDPLPFAPDTADLKSEDARPTISFFDMLKDLD